MGTALGSMTAIREFCRSVGIQSSEASVMSLIVHYNFPAVKIMGQWNSNGDLILEWHRKIIAGESTVQEAEEPVGAAVVKTVSTSKTPRKPLKTHQKHPENP